MNLSVTRLGRLLRPRVTFDRRPDPTAATSRAIGRSDHLGLVLGNRAIR